MANHPSCAVCGEPMNGVFCAHCGEKRLSDEERSLRHVLGHAIEATTNANGKALLTLRALVWHPGTLTADHIRGCRKPYVSPLQLFLLANLIFFLLHPLIGSNTLTTSLNTHLHYAWHHRVAQAMIGPRLAQRGLTAEAYAASFDAAAITQAKSLVILLVPIFAVIAAVFFGRTHRTFVDHLIFALHFCTFWLLMICVVLTLTNATIRLLRSVNVFPSAGQVSATIFAVTLVVMAGYLFQAIRAVYHRRPAWLAVAKAIALAVAFDLSLEVYRFALFFLTFWST